MGLIFLMRATHRIAVDYIHLSTRNLEDAQQSGGQTDTTNGHIPLLWSFVLPLVSLSILSWVAKHGRRCCNADDVMDDEVPREFCSGDMTVREERNTSSPYNKNDDQDIELQEVAGKSLSDMDRLKDPVGGLSLLDTSSCFDAGKASSDLSFGWMNGSLSTANYLNLRD